MEVKDYHKGREAAEIVLIRKNQLILAIIRINTRMMKSKWKIWVIKMNNIKSKALVDTRTKRAWTILEELIDLRIVINIIRSEIDFC